MKLADRARSRARQTFRAGGFAGATAAMVPLYLAHRRASKSDEQELVREQWVERWARALLRLFRIDVVVQGGGRAATEARAGRGRLIVMNHRSAIDIGVILATFPASRIVSRADLASWPLVGAAARSVGTVFVDRASAKSGAEAIRTIQRHLERGETVAIFPEGTTFAGDEVRPFHRGAFIAAARAGASVLPVGVAYPTTSGAAFLNEPFTTHLARMARSDSTRMAISIGEEIETPEELPKAGRAAALAERAHREVSRLVLEARAVAGP